MVENCLYGVDLNPLAVDLVAAPFSPAVRDAAVVAVDRITAVEAARGDISRTVRSALSATAPPYQTFLDDLFFGLAGLTIPEIAALKERSDVMKRMK